MVFSGPVFLFAFLPAVLLCYYLSPRFLRNPVLLVLSLVFYGWEEPRYLWLMAAVIAVNFFFGLLMTGKRRNIMLAAMVGVNLLCLGYFKYAGAVFGIKTVLPMGISFYIFQAMSYGIDVYRQKAPVQKNLFSFATYIALFPQLVAGPILRYGQVARQLENRRENGADFASGIGLFLVGLSKKLLLANPMGLLWDQLRLGSGTLEAWVGLGAFSLQIYFDFSAYSDMARGLGRMFGFSFPQNFDYPYMSLSVTEFWRRWHISLSSWFREYVYIPLGGNRKGPVRQGVNLLIVWMLTGLWHGAGLNFLLWGLYYGLLLILEKHLVLAYADSIAPILRRVGTLVFVMLGWALFYFEDLQALPAFLSRLFVYAPTDSDGWICIRANLFYLAVACCGATPALRIILLRHRSRPWVQWGRLVGAAVAMLLCMGALAGEDYNPFLYFRF